MRLSVIIVNYNVQYFLEQCLISVQHAIRNMDAEVFVVDNRSVDGSVEMVKEKFPWVKLIANQENTGFSKANNQAMRTASGEYILLLNPDTVIEEDTLIKVTAFMDAHPEAGGLGVKMVDGKGRFLPESKRGLPTPETSFYKIFGISRLFPRSKTFNRYYLGHLSNDEVHEIEILSGAFMLMRKSALDKVGLLDEAFFMYGEDIDLSWRIIQGGYKNYYFPETRIIHYKGESTKKGSLNYVFVFYNAMVIFARKHFSEKHASLFSFFINIAIWIRAGAAIINRFLKAISLPLFDIATTLGGLWVVETIYAGTKNKIYDPQLLWWAFIAYSVVWSFSALIGGAYDNPLRPEKSIRPVMAGSALLLMLYSLLPEYLRFSRAILLAGSVAAIVLYFVNRIIYNLLSNGKTGLEKNTGKRFAIVGSAEEIDRVRIIISQTNYDIGFIAKVSAAEGVPGFLGSIHQLEEIIRVHNIQQVVFCARDITSRDIIGTMNRLETQDIEFKIAPPESLYIIGSNSIETSGDVFILDVNSLSKPQNKRVKRFLDISLSLIMIPLLPVLLFIIKKPSGLIRNILLVLIGKKSWVGFDQFEETNGTTALPHLKKGVLTPSCILSGARRSPENIQKLNIVYAKDYKVVNDLRILLKGLNMLGE